MNDWRLTEAEIQAILDQPGRDTDDDRALHHAVADAATAKALREVGAWLLGEVVPSFSEHKSHVVADVANILATHRKIFFGGHL